MEPLINIGELHATIYFSCNVIVEISERFLFRNQCSKQSYGQIWSMGDLDCIHLQFRVNHEQTGAKSIDSLFTKERLWG